MPARIVCRAGVPLVALAGGAVFAGYYGVLFVAPSLVERATGAGSLVAGALLVPAALCAVVTGRIIGPLVRRIGPRRVLVALLVSTSVGVGLAAGHVLGGAAVVVVGTAGTVVGFAGCQAVLSGLVPALVEARDRDIAQGLINFVVFQGGAVGPALVGGILGVMGAPGALGVLALLPLAALAAVLVRARATPALT